MKNTPDKSKIEYAIVCDDVRREDNGKLIIIGVYASDITVNTLPAVVPLRILLAIRPGEAGPAHITTRVVQEGKEVFRSEGDVNFDMPDALGMINVGNFMLQITKETEIKVQGKIDKSRYQSLCRLRVGKTNN